MTSNFRPGAPIVYNCDARLPHRNGFLDTLSDVGPFIPGVTEAHVLILPGSMNPHPFLGKRIFQFGAQKTHSRLIYAGAFQIFWI
jgi:hypothetical protein